MKKICGIIWISLLWGILGTLGKLIIEFSGQLSSWLMIPLAIVGGVAMVLYFLFLG